MTSRDQLSFMEMGCGLFRILLSFSDGRSNVGPKTVARLCKDILLTPSFSVTLWEEPENTKLDQHRQFTSSIRTQRCIEEPGHTDSDLLRWSSRKRKVTRLGSGSDNSRLSIQLSLATLSERAAGDKEQSTQAGTTRHGSTGRQDAVTDRWLRQSLGTARR